MKRATAIVTLSLVAAALFGLAGAATALFLTAPSPALGTPQAQPTVASPAALVVHDSEIVSAQQWIPRPTSTRPLTILTYDHFEVGYDEQAKNPAWVTYSLSGPIVHRGQDQRPSTFSTEFRTAAHVADRDYRNSGFDRGHLCPSYAMYSRFGVAGMKATFVMTNVVPQYHGLNAGEWEQLEEAIAGRANTNDGWAAAYGPLWVINGPIYDQRPAQEQLKNGTRIPSACFSVVLRTVNGQWDALAFIMPNANDVSGPVSRYLTSIIEVQRQSGLEVLAGFPAEAGRPQFEVQRAASLWSMRR